MTVEDLLDEGMRTINTEVALLEKGIARASYRDLAELTRVQGKLEGLEMARNIFLNLVHHANEE